MLRHALAAAGRAPLPLLFVVLLGVALLPARGRAVGGEGEHPDIHPPIGVFGELVHARGHVELSYRYQGVGLEGLMDGTTRRSLTYVDAVYTYSVIPQSMRSDAHVVEFKWVPLDEVTVVLGLPFLEKEMKQVIVANGMTYSSRASGFGDIVLSLLYRVFEDSRSRVHLNLGLSFPSGSTNETDTSPLNPGQLERLPYAMQLGSGTIDLQPGFTYNGFWRGMAWGTQVMGILHSGSSGEGYKKGNQYTLNGWFGRRWAPWLTTNFRLAWQQWFDPVGADEQLELRRDPTSSLYSPSANSPATEPDLQNGRRLDALFGLDFYVREGVLSGTRLAVEAGLPAYQYVDGPQLRTKWLVTAGAQYAF